MRVIRAAGQRQMAWKNGGGTTTEIALSPVGAAIADFDWRVSMARIDVDGAFSEFPGIERTLSILAGDGITLSCPGADEVQLTTASPPHAFPADIPAHARLLGGSVVDLNVMTRRGVYHSTVTRLEASSPTDLTLRAQVTMLFCYTGALTIKTRTGTRQAGPRDCAIFDTPEPNINFRTDDGGDVFMIELHRCPMRP